MVVRSVPEEVAIVVEALGVLRTRDGFDVPTELVEERARNAIAALRGSYAIVPLGPTGLADHLSNNSLEVP